MADGVGPGSAGVGNDLARATEIKRLQRVDDRFLRRIFAIHRGAFRSGSRADNAL